MMNLEEQQIDWQELSPTLKLSIWAGILLNEINSIEPTNTTVYDALSYLILYTKKSFDLLSIDFQKTIDDFLLDHLSDPLSDNVQVNCIILSIASSKLLSLTEMRIWKSDDYDQELELNTLLIIMLNIIDIAKIQDYKLKQLIDSSVELLK